MGKQATMIAAIVLRGVALLIFFYPVRWLVRCCPWQWALKLGTLLGFLHASLFADELTRRIREGIQAVQPDGFSVTKLRRFVCLNLVTRYKHLIDSFFYQHLDTHLIEQMVPTIDGKAYLDETLNKGNGAILLVSHFGSFGMLIGGLALRGYRLHQIFTLTPQSHYRTWRWVG